MNRPVVALGAAHSGRPLRSRSRMLTVFRCTLQRTVALLEAIMDHRVEDFVHRQNLARFKRQLDNASDDAERKVLQALLSEEELKQPKVNRG
jgi:hypothetical protein